ncbi:MAG: LptF/LptG family permease [Myxococcota bacterium]|jgi:lipopolysaccharide export LptBFGC system permease protein LptF|nr:LptF/LptG family permease [Myxococcota bacterium]
MTRIGRHFLGRLMAWTGLCLMGATAVLLSTQGLRLFPLLSGSGASPAEIGGFLGLAAIPVLGWAMAPAACLALFIVIGTMEKEGELVALLASGISVRRLWPWIAAALTALMAAAALIALLAGPLAGARLRQIALSLCGRALSASVLPGELRSVVKGVSMRFERHDNGVLQSVFFADERNSAQRLHLAARTGKLTVEPAGGMLHLRLEKGTAFVDSSGSAPHAAISFDTLNLRLPIASAIEERAGFLPPLLLAPTSALLGARPAKIPKHEWEYALWRRLASIAAVAVLGIAASLLALSAPRRRTAGVLFATLLFLSYQLTSRFFEELSRRGSLSAAAAAALPLLAPLGFACAFRIIERRRRQVYPHASLE